MTPSVLKVLFLIAKRLDLLLLDYVEWSSLLLLLLLLDRSIRLDRSSTGPSGSLMLLLLDWLVRSVCAEPCRWWLKFSLLHFDETYSNVFHTNRKEHD